jgi:hypothetical protein
MNAPPGELKNGMPTDGLFMQDKAEKERHAAKSFKHKGQRENIPAQG